MMCCQPPLTDASPLYPNTDWPCFSLTPLPVYILGMTFCAVKYPFGQFRSPVPSMLPPVSLV